MDSAYSGGQHLTDLRKENENKSAQVSLETSIGSAAAKKPLGSVQEMADVLKSWSEVVSARELDLDLKRHLPAMAAEIYEAVNGKTGDAAVKAAKPVIEAWLSRSRKEEVSTGQVPNVVYVSSNPVQLGEGQVSTPINMIPGRSYHLFPGPATRWSAKGSGGGMNFIDLLVQDGTYATSDYEKSLGGAEAPKFFLFSAKSYAASPAFGKDVAKTVESEEGGSSAAHELMDSNEVLNFHRSMMGDGTVEDTFREFSKNKTPLQIMSMMGTLDSETRGALEKAYAGYNGKGDPETLLKDTEAVRDFHQKTLKADHADNSADMKNEILESLPSVKDMYSELSTMSPESFLETVGGTRENVKLILDMIFPDSGMTFVHDKRSVDAAVKASLVNILKKNTDLLDLYTDLAVPELERSRKSEEGSVLHTQGLGRRHDIVSTGFSSMLHADFKGGALSKNGSRFLAELDKLRKENPELFDTIFMVTNPTNPEQPGNQATGALYNEEGSDIEHRLLVKLRDSAPKGYTPPSPKELLKEKRGELAHKNLVKEYDKLRSALGKLSDGKIGRKSEEAEDEASSSAKFLEKTRKESPELFSEVFTFVDPSTTSALSGKPSDGLKALNITESPKGSAERPWRYSMGAFKLLQHESPVVWDALMSRSYDKTKESPEAQLAKADDALGATVDHGLPGSTYHHARNDVVSRLRMDKGAGDISTKLSKSITERVLGEIEGGINSAVSSSPAFKHLRSVMKKLDRIRSGKSSKSEYSSLEELLSDAKKQYESALQKKNEKNKLSGVPEAHATEAGLKSKFLSIFRSQPRVFQEDWLGSVSKVPKLKEKFSKYLEGYSVASRGGLRSPSVMPKKAGENFSLVVKLAASKLYV
jgi:hypothetical protein